MSGLFASPFEWGASYHPENDRFGVWAPKGYGPTGLSALGGGTAGGGGVPVAPSGLAPAGATSGSGFNLNPRPTSGQGAFGAVPGQLGLPNPAGDLGAQIPGLSGLNSQASSNILSKLKGELSKSTLDSLKNTAAAYGVSSGMPGSGLSDNAFLGNIAGAREALTAQGIGELNALSGQTSQTQTVNPALQNEIATQNSLNAAAPDPTQANSFAMQLYNMYLSKMGGGSPAGGTGIYGGGGGIAGQVNAAVNPVLSRYESDLDRRLTEARSSPSGYTNPQSIQQAPGAGKFYGASSSYAPIQFNDIAPQFNYQASPWNTDLYGTKQDIPIDFAWE